MTISTLFPEIRHTVFMPYDTYPRGLSLFQAREGTYNKIILRQIFAKYMPMRIFQGKGRQKMEIREGYMPWNGHQTYFRIAGKENPEKAPLILIHGGPGSTHNYFEVLDETAAEDGRQFICYDQIGCGNSYLEGHPELWNAETWVNELIRLREYLGLKECHLLGQSWGGMLILEYICNYPHSGIKSLILSSTLPSSELWGREQARMIRELPAEMQEAIRRSALTGDWDTPESRAAEEEYMLRHAGGPFPDDAPECLRREKRFGAESYLVAWGPNEYTPQGTLKDFNVITQLPFIREPALIISGGNDLSTPYIAKTMYDGIPDSRWELFEFARHTCYVEDLPRYSALLKEWLNAHD